MHLGPRHPLEHRPADGRARRQPAAQEQVVALQALALRSALAQRRALEADVADPVVGAGVRAAVEVQAQAGRRLAERRLQMLDDALQPSLGLGHRVVAERVAGAGDAGAAQRPGVDGEAERGHAPQRLVQALAGDVAQDEVLPPRQADLSPQDSARSAIARMRAPSTRPRKTGKPA